MHIGSLGAFGFTKLHEGERKWSCLGGFCLAQTLRVAVAIDGLDVYDLLDWKHEK